MEALVSKNEDTLMLMDMLPSREKLNRMLQRAIEDDDIDGARELVATGDNIVNDSFFMGQQRHIIRFTPLSLAVAKGFVPIVDMLLKAGADTNAKTGTEENSILMGACEMGHEAIAMLLLDHGSHPDKPNNWVTCTF